VTVQELIKELQNYDEDAEVILVWHGYMRKLVSTELVEPGLVQIIDAPKTD
jgi:hypothetical protein